MSALLFFRSVLDFFLPRECAGCTLPLLSSEDVICPRCSALLIPVKPEVTARVLFEASSFEPSIHNVSALFLFEPSENQSRPMRNAVHAFKFGRRIQIGKHFARHLARKVKEEPGNEPFDVIIPIPLHRLRRVWRGFNQAEVIAHEIAKELHISVNTSSLRRIRNTASQTKLNRKQRVENLKNAFVVTSDASLKGRSVLLLDDVITTGATLFECSRLLAQAGVKSITIAALALRQ